MGESKAGSSGCVLALAGGSLLVLGCGDNGGDVSADSLSRLMDDGDVAAVAPGRRRLPPR